MRNKLNLIFFILLVSCAQPKIGPDKQFAGGLKGAALGAGAGAVTGAQLSAATGPAALVGAGLGAVYGSIQGMVQDANEQHLMVMGAKTRRERERAVAQEILQDQTQRRMELHPGREIYPADLFFYGDEAKHNSITPALVRELAFMNKARYSWSRLGIVVYVQSKDKVHNEYAKLLAQDRAALLGDLFVTYGIQPRRIETRAVVTAAPILIDPEDHPARYAHAIEIVPLDK